MTDKVTLGSVASFQNDASAVAQYNTNNAALTTALDNTLSRDGTSPNQMGSTLDMNSNRIVNLPLPANSTEPLRLQDAALLNGGGTISSSPLPVGGTTGQVLAKSSNADYAVGWVPATSSALNITSGKTLSVTNTLTLSGTDSTVMTFPTTSDTVATTTASQSLSNKTIDTASNTVKVAGTPLTAVTGTGSVTLSTSPTIISPTFSTSITAPNLVSNAALSQVAAVTFKGNPTGSTANVTDFTVGGLTALTVPDATNDYLPIWDHSANSIKKISPSTIASSVVAGVSSIAGNSGAFTLGTGLTNSSNIILADATYHRGYLAGCNLSGGGSQVLTVSAGVVCSDDASTLMKLPSTFTKAIQTTWAVGTGNGGLDTGSIATSTWYHVYIIARPDTGLVDVLVSTNATAPTLPTNYTVKRRIGSIKTDGSSNILAFNQLGDEFILAAMVNETGAGLTVGTAAVLQALVGVPLGVRVNALNRIQFTNAAGSVALVVTAPDENDQATSVGFDSQLPGVASQTNGFSKNTRTNTSQTIRIRGSAASSTVFIQTYGWVDTRGRFA